MKADITTYLKTMRNATIEFNCYKGFDRLLDLKKLLLEKGISYSNCAIVYFMNTYYAILFEDYDREYMIGKDNIYYTNDKYMLIKATTKAFKPKFIPTHIKVQDYRHKQLFYDLKAIDSNVDIFVGGESILNTGYGKTYAILLALSFIGTFFERNTAHILDHYFFDDYTDVFRNSNIKGINPFKGKVIYENGDIRNFQFFNRAKPNYRYY